MPREALSVEKSFAARNEAANFFLKCAPLHSKINPFFNGVGL